jgi:signal transduction histidine kinase/AmiR/NasT family two-component response regulator
LIGLILGLYNAAAAVEFCRGQQRSPLPSRPIAAVLLAVVGLIYVICGPMTFFFPFRETANGLPNALWFTALAGVSVGLMAGTSILLVALTKEQAELRSTTALANARDIAREASEQKTRFLARMSHELRTPLNGVLGLAQVLARDPDLTERQHKQAATLEQAGQHLLAILNEVLDLSRIESGKLSFSPQPVILAELLRETLALIQADATSKRTRLTLDMAADLPDTVRADAMRLRQILLNLLSNGLKFTPRGGRVSLAVAPGAGVTIHFTITDTGPGVPATLRPRLFQDYTQADDDNIAGGSGLGLAISARLAEAMRGELTHADGPGGIGSRFTLSLPLPVVPRAVVAPVIQPSQPPRGLRILVVDDVSLNRVTARALLHHAGHEVVEAEDGPAALATIVRGPLPDVVLMDQSMPGMDGHSAARHIRAMPAPAGLVPILAVTANALPEDIEASLAAGMDGHVSKPIELKALLAAIAGALDTASRRRSCARPVDRDPTERV